MNQKVKIYGAALDALSSPERINLKLAYINHLRNEFLGQEAFKDPYDFTKTYITKSVILNNKIKWAGKISIPSWLTPKPKMSDSPNLSVDKIDRFLKGNGCWEYALMVADYINKTIYPGFPVMIGVDHSLTGGSIMALAERYPNLNVVIFDAHFDVMKIYQNSGLVFDLPNTNKMMYEEPLNYYECGNFLEHLLERGIISCKNLWILGVQDEIRRELRQMNDSQKDLDLNMLSIKKWMEKGVHVIFKDEVRSGNFRLDLNGPTYFSVDMDVGSMSSIYSARFMNSYGLNTGEFLQLLNKVSRLFESSSCPLVGLDVMELDVHFFEAAKEGDVDDRTEDIVKEIFELFVNRNESKYLS